MCKQDPTTEVPLRHHQNRLGQTDRKVAEYVHEFHSRENVDTDAAVMSTTNLPNIAELHSPSSLNEHR